MPFVHITDRDQIDGEQPAQGLMVYGDNKPILIAEASVISGYRILRTIVATGVRVSATGDYEDDAADKARQLALRWFAGTALAKGGNAVINFRRARYKPSTYRDRDDHTTDYDCDCSFTGKIAVVRTERR